MPPENIVLLKIYMYLNAQIIYMHKCAMNPNILYSLTIVVTQE